MNDDLPQPMRSWPPSASLRVRVAYKATWEALNNCDLRNEVVAKMLSQALDNLAQAYFDLTGVKLGTAP